MNRIPAYAKLHLLLVVVAGVSIAVTWSSSRGELTVYEAASDRMAAGEEIYRHEDGRQFTYPPFAAMALIPLSVLPDAVALPVWYGLNLLLLIWILRRLGLRLRPMIHHESNRHRMRTGLFVFALALLTARHLLSPLEYRSHDVLVFALLWLAIEAWCNDQAPVTGLAAGLAAAFKATPLVFLPLLVWHRRWKAAGIMVVAAVTVTLLPDLLFPQAGGSSWARVWLQEFASTAQIGSPAESDGAWETWNHLNQSLGGTVYRLFTDHVPLSSDEVNVSLWHLNRRILQVLTAVLQLSVIALVAWIAWPGRSRHLSPQERSLHRLGEGGILLAAMLLLSPMSSKYHFATLVVPLGFVAADFFYRERHPFVGAGLAGVLLLGSFTSKGLIGKELGNKILALGSVTACAALAMVTLAFVLWRREKVDAL